jgi:hypothetical protein
LIVPGHQIIIHSSYGDDDFLPEEHFVIEAPAHDLNAKQYFKLFEKFLLCAGMDPVRIRKGAMSLVFSDWVSEEVQRQVCKEYELTMDEHLEEKFKEWQVREEEIAQIEKSTNEKIVQYYKQSEPKIKGDWEYTKEEIEQTNLEEEV